MRGGYFRGEKPPCGTELDRTHPIARGLLLAAVFNEGDGGGYKDGMYLQPSSVPGTAPTWVSGPAGPALDFIQGTGAREIRFARNGAGIAAIPARFPVVSVFARMRGGDAANDNTVISCGEVSDNNYHFAFGRRGAGTLGIGDGNGGLATATSTASLSLAPWTCVGLAQRGLADRTFWLDGVPEVNTSSLSTNTVGAANPYCIGRMYVNQAASAPSDMEGQLDFVYLWERPLTNDEFAELQADPFLFYQPPVWRRYYVPAAAPPPSSNTNQYFLAL